MTDYKLPRYIPAWMDEGVCASMPIADVDRLFFDCTQPKNAIAICNTCPVRQECHDYADEQLITHGVWGGEGSTSRRLRLGITRSGDPILSAQVA